LNRIPHWGIVLYLYERQHHTAPCLVFEILSSQMVDALLQLNAGY
jgi:hypothetical protein